jgi:dienelactone hydrolase
MKTWFRRIALALAAFMVLGYLAICVFMYGSQEELIFHPTHEGAAMQALREAPGNEVFDLHREDAELHGALVLAPVEQPAPLLMYFGGNAEPVALKAESFAWMKEHRAHLLFLPYRGYDGSTGSPGADDMRADVLAAYDSVRTNPHVDPKQIYAMGYSLGSGLASYLAHQRELAGVVLVAPYRRLGEIAETAYPWLPVSSLLAHDFDTLAVAAEVEEQLLVIHGTQDTLIPIEHGHDVVAAWKGPSKLLPLEGQGHNGCSADERTQVALREFMGL